MKQIKTLLLIAAAVVIVCIIAGCKPRNTIPSMTQPDHTLPFSEKPPADAAEWTRLRIELDDARAANIRKDVEIANAENRKAAANIETWKQAAKYSWLFTLLGVGLLALSFLPWTRALFAGTGSVAFLFMGMGVFFWAAPHIVSNYGPYALIPMAATAAVYILCLAAIDIWKRVRKAKEEAVVCAAAIDPKNKDVGIAEVVAIREEHNKTFAAALNKELAKP